MRITPCGAVGEVTGSGYLLETASASVLIDFGMFQGLTASPERNARLGAVVPRKLDAVVLTHAHLDHCGRLPLLTRNGFRGRFFATPATIDLTRIILEDSARIQEGEARRAARGARRSGHTPAEPLYDQDDVELTIHQFRSLAFERSRQIAPGVTARFFEAGHILGAASLELTIDEGKGEKTVVFSGDVGPPGSPIIRDAIRPTRADMVFLESTYGDRDHVSRIETVARFHDLLEQADRNKRRIIIPAFAIGRTQMLLYYIAQAVRENRITMFPIYQDSPTGRRAGEVYAYHQHLYNEEALALAKNDQMNQDLRNLRILLTPHESSQLNHSHESCVIISSSGMCEGGRIMHHLKHNLWREDVDLVMVGYMAEGTLGRQIKEGATEVLIHGEPVSIRCRVHVLSGLSAHAGQTELLEWLEPVAGQHPRVVLTHGEDEQREALRGKIIEKYGLDVECPEPGDVITLE
ncbi:MBL fold metallo-hydrolase [soil metagenome]